jgi:threonine/homoserine/homoserine lactone efflux protein
MDQSLNVPIFPASVAVTSLSGVMMPGPVMAVTVAKGKKVELREL